MSLTRAFITTHRINPSWGYREIADFLHCDIHTLRGLNGRLKLPIPVRQKAVKGESKRLLNIRAAYKAKTIRIKPKEHFPVPSQTGSGRKQYGSYLKLL